MTDKNDYKELFKEKIFTIDDTEYHLQEVIVHEKGAGDDERFITIVFSAADAPEDCLNVKIPHSALFLMLRTFFSIKDAAGEILDDVEALATEAAKVSKKYKGKLARGLDAFMEEFKKRDQ